MTTGKKHDLPDELFRQVAKAGKTPEQQPLHSPAELLAVMRELHQREAAEAAAIIDAIVAGDDDRLDLMLADPDPAHPDRFRRMTPRELIAIVLEAAERQEEAAPAAKHMLQQRAAKARHAEDVEAKAQILAWYAKHRTDYRNKDDAADAGTKIVPHKRSTIRRWLRGA